jgi:hypothetical protein
MSLTELSSYGLLVLLLWMALVAGVADAVVSALAFAVARCIPVFSEAATSFVRRRAPADHSIFFRAAKTLALPEGLLLLAVAVRV